MPKYTVKMIFSAPAYLDVEAESVTEAVLLAASKPFPEWRSNFIALTGTMGAHVAMQEGDQIHGWRLEFKRPEGAFVSAQHLEIEKVVPLPSRAVEPAS